MEDRFNNDIVHLEHYGKCIECKDKYTHRYDTSIAAFICSERCSNSWNDSFNKWCEDSTTENIKPTNGIRVSFDILLGETTRENARKTMEEVQVMIDELLESKNICCTGGKGEFLLDKQFYRKK